MVCSEKYLQQQGSYENNFVLEEELIWFICKGE